MDSSLMGEDMRCAGCWDWDWETLMSEEAASLDLLESSFSSLKQIKNRHQFNKSMHSEISILLSLDFIEFRFD